MVDARDRVRDYLRRHASGEFAPDSMADRLIVAWAWCHAFGTIRTVDQRIVRFRANLAQHRIFVAMLDQAVEGKPVRIKIGKARKLGTSTLVQLLGVALCTLFGQQLAVTIAHESEATQDIFDIARLAASSYKTLPIDPNCLSELRWPATKSRYYCRTAGGTATGAGGTPSFLHQSEKAKWEKNKESTAYNSAISVPDDPLTIIVDESTFKGRDLFYDGFEAAQQGRGPYRALFLPWYVDERLVSQPATSFERDDYERGLADIAAFEGVQLTDANLQWRRTKLAELGPAIFAQEFPASVEEAITGAKGLVLPGMRNLLVSEVPFRWQDVRWEERVGGIDFGYHDPCVIWSGVIWDGALYVIRFWRGVETLASEQVAGLLEGHTYYCDPAGVSDRKNLERASYAAGLHCKFIPAPRRKFPGEDSVTTELQQVIRLAQDDRLWILESESRQLLLECDNYAWNEARAKPDETRSSSWGHFDSIAGLRYLVMGANLKLGRRAHVTVDETPRYNRARDLATI